MVYVYVYLPSKVFVLSKFKATRRTIFYCIAYEIKSFKIFKHHNSSIITLFPILLKIISLSTKLVRSFPNSVSSNSGKMVSFGLQDQTKF